MADLIIKELTDREVGVFVDFQYNLYKDDPYWVGDLKSNAKALLLPGNPFWSHARRKLFMAWRGGAPVARVAAIINDTHNSYHEDKVGFFGFFETANDKEASHAVLSAAADWLKAQGMETMRGPMNPSTNDSCGLLISGFDSFPKIMMPYNPTYYGAILEEFGLDKAKDLLAYIRFSDTEISGRLLKIIARIETRKDWRIRELRISALEHELETVREIYNDAWSENWGFVPISKAEMALAAKELKPILSPDCGHIIEVDNRPVAFSVIVPDVNVALRKINSNLTVFNFIKFLLEIRNIRQGRLMMLGVRKDFRVRGFDLVLIKRVIEICRKKKWLHGELSWILEDNYKIVNLIEECGGRVYKKYRIYEKPLVATGQSSVEVPMIQPKPSF